MFKTIHNNGILFYPSKEDAVKNTYGIFNRKIYFGSIKDMPREIAEYVAEVHENYEAYFNKAMAVLYKTYGKNKKGSENPVKAIMSLVPQATEEWYVIIYEIISLEKPTTLR